MTNGRIRNIQLGFLVRRLVEGLIHQLQTTVQLVISV